MKIAVIYLLAAAAALLGGVFTRAVLEKFAPHFSPVPMVAFNYPDVGGKLHPSSEWQGQILVINFWATWCPPCRAEMPQFVELQKKLADKGVVFIGIAIDDAESVRKFIKTLPVNYPILIAGEPGLSYARQLGAKSDTVPYTVIVNREAQLIESFSGEVSKNQLMAALSPLIGL